MKKLLNKQFLGASYFIYVRYFSIKIYLFLFFFFKMYSFTQIRLILKHIEKGSVILNFIQIKTKYNKKFINTLRVLYLSK